MTDKISVKICGLSNAVDALAAVRDGADALGFVMGGRVLPAEVEPHAQTVREIIRLVPKNVVSYLVTHLFGVDDILALSEYVGAGGIQVSEDIGVAELKGLRSRTDRKIIKTVVVQSEDAAAKMSAYAPFCDFILLDSRIAGYVGGTGMTSDWNLCRKLIEASPKPVYLAGGLTPANLEEALRTTHPFGADVSTGVSCHSDIYLKKDRKDPDKISQFIRTAKRFNS